MPFDPAQAHRAEHGRAFLWSAMRTCRADPSVKRVTVGDFQFPLGVYPVEEMKPVQGYRVQFEPSDGDEEGGEWEAWPDRYMFEIVITSNRLESLCKRLFGLMPGRVYPILDILGTDAYREIDPYISYELIGLDRFTDALKRFRDYFFEDGTSGFGAMSEEPFSYVFVDEHKIIIVRVEADMKERVEKLLEAYDVPLVDEPAGADAAAHEHRIVLDTPDDSPDLLSCEEIVEQLREDWELVLNIDPDTNLDDEGNELGITSWRCLVRCDYDKKPTRYAEVLLDAENLGQAEKVALEAVAQLKDAPKDPEVSEATVVAADRVSSDTLKEVLADKPGSRKKRKTTNQTEAQEASSGTVHRARWLGSA